MINILNLFSWTTWLVFLLIIIFIFWIIYGGNNEYEFVGVKPLMTPEFDTKHVSFDIEEEYDDEETVVSEDSFIPPLFEPNKTNSGEDIVYEIFTNLVQAEVKRNIRPSFLKNPETKQNLELDCYCEKYSLAVEYNGAQHYIFPSKYHKNEKEFINQVYRDRLKQKLCDKAGIYLISVPYWVDQYEDYEQHLNKEIGNKSQIPRSVRYKRIYNYLYQKISEYFEIILMQKQNDQYESNFDRWP